MRPSGRVTAFAASIALAAAPLHADDTEIFVGSTEVSKKPNVLFVVDTSGSMEEEVLVPRVPYDPEIDYDGNCDGDWIYWSHDAEPPSCYSGRRIRPSQTNSSCDDMKAAVDSPSGRAISPAQQRRGFIIRWWRSLQSGNDDDTVRCSSGSTYHFFSANYTNWFNSDAGTADPKTRMEVVQEIAEDLVDSISGVNIGLMRFDRGTGSSGYGDHSWSGGYVDLEIGDIVDNRESFKEKLNSYYPSGSTPMTETLYEAARYWRGEGVEYGLDTEPGTSTSGSRTGSTYNSPIEHECQKNHVVFLSDGQPQYDSEADEEIRELTGNWCNYVEADSLTNCFDDLAEYLYNEDQSSTVGRTNRVITHTVGFGTDLDLLSSAAQKGGGRYYTADDYDGLKTALETLFSEILAGTSLFTAPAVSVNAFNRLEHLNQVYFALFRPDEGALWPGNIKRYEVDEDTGKLMDASDPARLAIDEATGQFRDQVRSFWSDEEDGNDVESGGAAGEIEADRNVYTNIGADAAEDLTADSYVLHEDNDSITQATLGVASPSYRERLLRWARGLDVDDDDGDGETDDVRATMGDPLHSRPELVTYGTSANDPQLTLFVTTNQGYLHAIDTDSGDERWAFMPKEMLSQIPTQYENPIDSGDRSYGLDGPLSVDDRGDTVRLYASMRRGGRQYYGLDVTDRDKPGLMWTIHGGSGDYEELGQTWSRAIPTRIDIDGEQKDVIIFAGGYDTRKDTDETRVDDGQGRAIFIADASDGSLLWYGGGTSSAGDPHKTFSGMDYSIPSDIRVIDINNDGLADRLYVGDAGGQLWRFDIDNGEQAANLVTGGVIADLAADDEAANARRFYYAPDVALMEEHGEQWLSISIGSGWRAHPLDEVVEDRFYMIRDHDIFDPPTDANGNIRYDTIGESNLHDATDNVIGEGTAEQKEAALDELLNDKHGWFIRLENGGEKVMAESVTLDGAVMFTTYQPDKDGSSSSCAPGEGISRAYIMNVADATPVSDQDGDGETTAEDRVRHLERGGIPPGPTVMVIDGKRIVWIGPEQPFEGGSTSQIQQIYWRQ